MRAVFIGPRLVHAFLDKRWMRREKGPSDVLGEGKVSLPIAGIVIVVEYPTNPTRKIAVLDHEILISPGFVAWVIVQIVFVAFSLVNGMEERRVLVYRDHRI